MTDEKPVLFWAFWPDELSRAMEKYFSIRYCQTDPAPAPKWNTHLPAIFDEWDRKGGRPVALFLHVWSLCDSLLGLDRIGVPSIAYFHDAHFDLNSWMWDLSQVFDWVLLDTKQAEEYFVRRGALNTVTYCPLYYKGPRSRVARFDPRTDRGVDVAFVGNWSATLHPERHAFFRGLTDRLGGGVRCQIGLGNYDEVYPRAKIVINETVLPSDGRGEGPVIDAPNFRLFEAMGCGAMLLCDSPAPSVRALFRVGRDLAEYEHGNVQDAADKVNYYLERTEERLAIADSGWRQVLDHHTADHRAEMIASQIMGSMEQGRGRELLSYPDACFLLGRSILRQCLIWRRQAPSIGHPAFEERMVEAQRLLERGIGAEQYGAVAASLLPLVPHLLGRREEAIEGWKKLKGTESHVFAAAFLAGCAVKDPRLRPEADSFGPAPPAGYAGRAEEFEVFKEILGDSVLRDPQPGQE